jgi:hypothetical protein
VLWSNQRTEMFGMKTHADGASPTAWSEDEMPASQSAQNVGAGFADDHLNMAVGSDGTLYCAVKTGYDTPGYDKLILLVRRPNGAWDNAYEVTEIEGTRPIVMLNEAIGKIRVVYTSQENGGDILYRESGMSPISFSSPITLLKGKYNYISSTKANHTTESVIIATDVSSTDWKAVGLLVTDPPSLVTGSPDENSEFSELKVFPNPFTHKAALSFTLMQGSDYVVDLFDSKGARIRHIGRGRAVKGAVVKLDIDGQGLPSGLYLIRLRTESGERTLRLMHSKN